jgi:triphosphoribosyl-dephospho-CoA synthase
MTTMSHTLDEGRPSVGDHVPATSPDDRAVAGERIAADHRVSADERVCADVAAAAQLACLLEVTAPKPGNVSPGRRFEDIGYEDFLASAAAIGGPLARAGTRPLGATVRLAVEATARWTRSNTNLGMVLLLAPLARAATRVRPKPNRTPEVRLKPDTTYDQDDRAPGIDVTEVVSGFSQTSDVVSGFPRTLRDALRDVLAETTVDDAREAYAAIRRAAPGGLGRADAQDVAGEPTLTLVEIMRLAADRDGIASEYATAFERTFETGVPALEAARRDGLSWNDAIVETFLTLLAAAPDTHIVRRGGAALADDVSARARSVLAAGGVRAASGRGALDEMDRALRGERHPANPGTTADLTAAVIFVVLLASNGI